MFNILSVSDSVSEYGAIFVFIIIIAVGVLSSGIIPSFFEAKKKRRRSFKNAIQEGIVNGRLEWEDLEILAQRWKQNKTDIYFVLSDLLNESLMNKEDSGKQLYEKVKELLLKQQQSEPFSELPESIRIHIENVSSQFNENGNETLRPLVSSIRDTIIEAERKAEAQRLYTKYSCLVGIISLLIGIASLIFAINKIRSEANTEIPNNINIQSDSNASLPE